MMVLLVTTLLTILMLSLMGAMLQSSQFVNVSTNTVKTKLSAERAVEEATARIEATVNGLNGSISGPNPTLTPSILPSTLSSDLTSIQNQSGSGLTIQENVIKNDLNSGGLYLDKLTLTAPLNNSNKKLVRTMTVSTAADIFRYSVVTDGDLILNGASYLTGNIYVSKNLYISNQGKYLNQQLYQNGTAASTTYYFPKTSFPAVTGNVTIKGDAYSNSYVNHTCSGECGTLPDTHSIPKNSINDYFYKQYDPTILNDQIQSNEVDIGGAISSAYNYWKPILNQRSWNWNPNIKAYSSVNLGSGNYQVNGDLVILGNLTMSRSSTLNVTGNIYIGGSASLSGTITASGSNGIYINQSLYVNNLTMNGKMYVNGSGDTTIQHDFSSNGSVYSNGNIIVSDLTTNTNNDTLLLLSKGNILLKNNNEFSAWDNKKILNAYFYSNGDLEIYGIGSNLEINGGVYSSHSITLNAVKGTTTSDGQGFVGSIASNQDTLPQ